MADAHTPATAYTQVIVTAEEDPRVSKLMFSVHQRYRTHPDISDYPLQLTAHILGAEETVPWMFTDNTL
jgi:hypothetical protein